MGLDISINALVLSAVLFLVARHEADFEYLKTFYIIIGIILSNLVLSIVLVDRALPLLHALGGLGLAALIILIRFSIVVLLVWKFCWVRFWKAIIVAVLFVAVNATIEGLRGEFRKKLLDVKSEPAEAAQTPVTVPKVEKKKVAEPSPPGLPPGISYSVTAKRASATVVTNLEPYSAAAWAEATKALKVQKVQRADDGTYRAVIRGVSVGENQRIALEFQGHQYQWLVVKVTEKGPQVQPVH